MTHSIPISRWEIMDAEMESALSDYRSAMTDGYNDDFDAIYKAESRIRDELGDGWTDSSADDWRRYKQAINDKYTEARDEWNKFRANYDSKFKPHLLLAATLDDHRKTLEDAFEELGEFHTQLGQSQIGASWSGKGAENYMKQVPIQVTAMSDLKYGVDTTRWAMEESSVVQQTIYLSIWSTLLENHSALVKLRPNDGDLSFGERIYTIYDMNFTMRTWLEEFEDEVTSTWGSSLQQILGTVEETEYEELSDSNWPAATVDSEGYTPNENAPTTPPTTPPPATPTNTTPESTGPNVDNSAVNSGPNDGLEAEDDAFE